MKLTNLGKFRLYKMYSFIAYLIPMLVLFLVEHEKYLSTPSYSFSFFGYAIVFLIIIAFKNVVLECLKKNLMLSLSLTLFIVSIITYYLADNLLLISFVSVIGSAFSFVVDKVADVYYANAYVCKDNNGIKQKNPAQALSDKEAWKIAYWVIEETNENE